MHHLRQPDGADLGPLSRVGWLSEQPAALAERLALAGRWVDLPMGRMLYSAGDDADALFGLGEGALEILVPGGSGEMVLVHRAVPGWWIGDSALLARSTRLITIIAAAPCRIFRVPGATLREILRREPDYWSCFYALSHRNSALALSLLTDILALSPKARLARVIQRLADAGGRVQISQGELAALIGANRSTLRLALADLTEAGAVATRYRGLQVLDRDRLAACWA